MRDVRVVANRFLQTREGLFDLASGAAVTLRQLAPCEPADERRWADACSRLLRMWHEDLPLLLDYGFLADGRFEAYEANHSIAVSSHSAAALVDFLGEGSAAAAGAHGPPRIGIRLVVPTALVPLTEILDDGRPGRPLSVSCIAEPGGGATTFLRLAASSARSRGYLPVSVNVLDRWPHLIALLRGHSVLLLCDASDSAQRGERWFFRLGLASVGSHLWLRVSRRSTCNADIALRLEPVDCDLLAASARVYPAMAERQVRVAAERSAGIPARFVAWLRQPDEHLEAAWRVAEAHPAYTGEDVQPEPEVEHPWRDLIAVAVRLAESGRTAAAERDLRQIAAAAERRHITHAAAAAEVELAYILLARGRTEAARLLFATRAEQHAAHHQLGTRAAIGLGFVHLLAGELEWAESAFRVCRAVCPAEAAVGLAWTLLVTGRDHEAERALVPARESSDGRVRARAAVVAAAIALARHDLPAAARSAAQAADRHDAVTEALAASLLMFVHGRIADREASERHARRAIAAARAARAPLLAIAVRATAIEAYHNCGLAADRATLDRLLRVAARVPPLVRARLLAVAARVHPIEQRRNESARQVESFIRLTGARAVSTSALEPPGAGVGLDAASLINISESSITPSETLKRVAEWLRDKLNARVALVCDATGTPLARAGAHESITAASRVLQTRHSQPPWTATNGLESAVLVRYSNSTRGVVACRWPLSHVVPADVVSVMTAAAAVVAPAIELLAEHVSASAAGPDAMVGRSPAMARLREQITRAAAAPFPVLIEGESGVGKELVARAIHREGSRRLRACVAINCAALSDDLFEAEVFGHARGAFTGAHAERAGLFEQADGGTLFLDEVSELSSRAQAKLLRALQEGEVRRVGENHARRVDVRVIAATNRRLEDEVTAGRFRRDLLFRLAVIRIPVPSLRNRREDIPLLAAHHFNVAVRRAGARSVLTPAAISRLSLYDWPGNVRELQNVIAALAVQVPRGRVGAEHVAALVECPETRGSANADGSGHLEDARRAFEREFIATAIARCGGRPGAAARQLGITRQGLAKLMKRLEIS